MNPSQRLKDAAIRLENVMSKRDLSSPLLKEASERLRPFLDSALSSQDELPSQLPSFFFGMHDGQLAASCLKDAELMNHLSNFDDALKAISLV